MYVAADTTDDAGVAGSAVVAHDASAAVLAPERGGLAPADAAPARRRLAGLDGVRGLAALYVVLNHIFLRTFPGYPVDRAPFWAAWLIYGRFAVVVFIVLSGFSLALAPARHGWRLGGVSRFARRRARRILPGYWAALVFSLAVAWLVAPPPGQLAPDAKSVVVNSLLVQNLVLAPIPDRSFWTIAVEAQLYILFPLLLLMVRRWGAIAMVSAVTLAVATVGIVAPHHPRLDFHVIQSPPDLAALFALGILGAGIVGASRTRRSWPWAWLALTAVVPVLALIWCESRRLGVDARRPALGRPRAGPGGRLPPDRAGHGPSCPAPAPARRARPIRNLGLSSYSLYLTHGPIVVVVYEKIVARPGSAGASRPSSSWSPWRCR